jgi:CHASE2 domain-containing sensor protein
VGPEPHLGPRRRWRAALVAAAVAAALGALTALTGAGGGLEHETVEARFRQRDAPAPSGIVVVAIDDVTFSTLRRAWPFPRSLHARAIDRLHAAGAREIVYDVQFTEPTEPREDLALYEAIERAGGAVLATSEVDDRGGTAVLGGDEALAEIGARAAASNLGDEVQGQVVRFPHDVAGLPTLGVVTAERVSGRRVDRSAFGSRGALIDFRGEPGSFPTLSFSDVLQGRFDPSAVRGQIVVVGASAPTLQDVHATPTTHDRLMSGPEVQANAIWTVLHGLPLRSAPRWLDLLAVLAMAVVMPLLGLRVRGLWPLGAAVALAGVFLVAAQVAFGAGVIVAVVAPLVALAAGTAGALVGRHLAEAAERRRLARESAVLEGLVRERTAELREAQFEVVWRLGQVAESRDHDTGRHIERIARLCHRLALAIGLSEAEAELIGHASALHDVGKIAIPDRVLLKPARLDDDDWVTMRTHTATGAQILSGSRSPLVQLGETIARTHHERWDGSGYPAGLAGEEIPLAGRICAICDVFDALLSPRVYKPSWTLEATVAEISAQRGHHFDPRLVDAFLPLAAELRAELYGPEADDPGFSLALAPQPAAPAAQTPAGPPSPPRPRSRWPRSGSAA